LFNVLFTVLHLENLYTHLTVPKSFDYYSFFNGWKQKAFTAAICNLRPSSRGSSHIRSCRVLDAPRIRPNYLSTPSDRQIAVDSIRLTREIVAQMERKYDAVEVLPGALYQTDEELVKAAGIIGTTIFHPVGTCAMGAVVDSSSLKVLGLENVRVCDASVMPTITSGNTHAPTLMIAEKLASIITMN
jgi:choline dehydrogenase